jgi:hypothetical protein
MKLKKALLVTGAASTIGLSSVAGMGVASAATTGTTNSNTDGMSSLVDKLATKFNLNKSDVQAVFDEDRSSHDAEMQQKLEERLNQAVTDGKITSAQKTLILNKQKEMKTFMDSLKGKTADERDSAMKTKMAELKTWASDNNIPEDYLGPMGHGPGGPGTQKGSSAAGSSSTSSN